MASMNFEGLEQVRYETTTAAMAALSKIVSDEKADMPDRLSAAKILDGYSDSLIKAQLTSEVTGVEEKTRNKLLNQMDKLDKSN